MMMPTMMIPTMMMAIDSDDDNDGDNDNDNGDDTNDDARDDDNDDDHDDFDDDDDDVDDNDDDNGDKDDDNDDNDDDTYDEDNHDDNDDANDDDSACSDEAATGRPAKGFLRTDPFPSNFPRLTNLKQRAPNFKTLGPTGNFGLSADTAFVARQHKLSFRWSFWGAGALIKEYTLRPETLRDAFLWMLLSMFELTGIGCLWIPTP